jgi:hypothetical protein
MTPLGYSREGDVVTLRMTHKDYANVVMAIGVACGYGSRENMELLPVYLALANRLNAGNPEWTAYELPAGVTEAISLPNVVRLDALKTRMAYLIEHADSIYVRVKIGERWEDYPLSELRGEMAISEAFRLLLRDEVPHRKIPQEQADGHSS